MEIAVSFVSPCAKVLLCFICPAQKSHLWFENILVPESVDEYCLMAPGS